MIVLVAGAEDATAVLAEAVAAGAAHIRFTEVDVRTTSSHSTNDRQIRMWGGVDELRDCDAVVFVPSLQADSNAALSEVLQTAEREPADTFLNTIFAVTGASDAAFLARIANLGGIIVSPPRGSQDSTRQAHALGGRVAKVVEWVRHARSHDHGHTHEHSHHHD